MASHRTSRIRTAAPPALADATAVTALDGIGGAARRPAPARAELGAPATTRHRTGGTDPTVRPPTARLAVPADPQRCLDGATVLERTGSHQATAVGGYARRLGSVRRLHHQSEATPEGLAEAGTAAEHLAEAGTTDEHLAAAGPALVAQPATAVRALGTAEAVRDRPGAEQRRPAAPDPRAARAVSFAYAALGKPYAWGATGPSAYDCSGLAQAAWKSAGVTLPRTTYTQINAGTRIDRSQLAPGDLVFFYSGISHVGICIGDGRMIHAPHPGAPVRIAPIDQLPFAGATRPA
ncbi:hypothetical protein GCM10010211_56880 [Streptomyces albospinus]|uniref:NlpC/P60 domain-containing protein n=1 Tax=Streptomyces albospinus TaxID=285515 RepID=A0ABQ2VIF2_9ACTN|nr:C40 family peptidase [Streptomyces albospinus]GGU83507.1 hypothetical protein GCM10010211_56880 [Streptomyces albospinus]